MQLASGDDKCITRWVIIKRYKLYHQLRNTCKLSTSFETGIVFFRQMLRWARNTWRSDLTALFREGTIWKNNPITAIIMLDKMLTPFYMLYGITYLPYNAITKGQTYALLGWVIWLFVSRVIKLGYYLYEHPLYIIYVPVFVIFQYVQAIIKIWALLTLSNRKWGNRSINVVNNQVVREIEFEPRRSVDESKHGEYIIEPIPTEIEILEHDHIPALPVENVDDIIKLDIGEHKEFVL
jgi:hypothetical protein